MEQVGVCENGNMRTLSAINDEHHDGVIVEMEEAMDSQVFASMLRASMALWKKQGKKGVWIKLPIELAYLIDVVVQQGFWFHHAEPTYLMLVHWIPDTGNTIPANASHRVGVGAFIMNHNREVLVVQEKNGVLRGAGVWKLPTGTVDEGEDISTAVMREVKEETNIDTEFVEVLAFRESHKSFFEKSDLFFLCMLRPLSFDIQKQDLELDAAQWMPFEEYAAQPCIKNHKLLKYMVDICSAKVDGNYSGCYAVPASPAAGFCDKKSHLYINTRVPQLTLNRSFKTRV